MRRLSILAAALGVALASGRAAAADANAPTVTQKVRTRTPNEGLTFSLQGGVGGYGGNLGPLIGRGGAWGLLIGAQATPILGLEADYNGASNALTGTGLRAGRIVRNSGSVDLKVAIIPSPVEPYIFGGLGLTRFSVSGLPTTTTGETFRDATAAQVPVGAGLNLYLGKLALGARVAYNFLLNKGYAPSTTRKGFDANTWNGQLNLGLKF